MTSIVIRRTAMLAVLALAVGTIGTTMPRISGQLVGLHGSTTADASDTRAGWQTSLEAMDRALAARDISRAEMAWRNAYGLAIRSGQWQALLAAGDGSLRLAERDLVKQPYRAHAREAWRYALFCARTQHSVDGVLKVAEAFAALGDTDVVIQALKIADGLTSEDASSEAGRRVREIRERLTARRRPPVVPEPILALFPDAAVGP